MTSTGEKMIGAENVKKLGKLAVRNRRYGGAVSAKEEIKGTEADGAACRAAALQLGGALGVIDKFTGDSVD